METEKKNTVDNRPTLLTTGETEPGPKAIDRPTFWANIISGTFSPLLIPTYAMAIAMWITPLNVTSENTRFLISLMVLFITGPIPFAMLLTLLKARRITNFELDNKRQRPLPILVTSLCYLAAALYILRLHAPGWLVMAFVGSFIVAVVVAVVSPLWKISAHGTGLGMILGMVLRLSIDNATQVESLPWITAILIIGGIVGAARIILDKHTPMQYIAGEVLGAVTVYWAMGLEIPTDIYNLVMPLAH